MEKDCVLVYNPTSEQLEKIIHNKKIRNKGKTIYFKDFIKEATKDPEDKSIIVGNTTQKALKKIKVKNERTLRF